MHLILHSAVQIYEFHIFIISMVDNVNVFLKLAHHLYCGVLTFDKNLTCCTSLFFFPETRGDGATQEVVIGKDLPLVQ